LIRGKKILKCHEVDSEVTQPNERKSRAAGALEKISCIQNNTTRKKKKRKRTRRRRKKFRKKPSAKPFSRYE